MSNLSTLPKGDSAWLLRKAIERIMEQVSVLETNIGSSTTGNSANTQIIFNDNGTLRGDAGLVYNKTTDALTVAGLVTAGSATITGDLTVRTTGLTVNSSGVGVGVTAALGAGNIQIAAGKYLGYSATAYITPEDNVQGARIKANNILVDATSESKFNIGGTLAMTLNSTGLGIGVSPGSAIGNLQVGGSTNANLYAQQGTDTIRIGVRASGRTGIILDSSNATYTNRAWYLDNAGSSGSLIIGRQGLDVITFDNVGNVGIGVVPSAWRTSVSFKALQIGYTGTVYALGATEQVNLSSNYLQDTAGNEVRIQAGYATRYQQSSGQHLWSTAGTSTAGSGITFTQAMTLDASGNLLVGKTATNLQVVGCELKANGTVFSTLVDTTDAAASSYQLYSTGAAAYRFYVGLGGTVFATNTTISAISDARLKENVQDIDVGLDAILALKPRKFDWKAGKGKDIKGDRGFIAQEFETVFPNLIDEWKDPAPEGEAAYKSVRQDLIPVLVKAIQELTARVQTLEAR